MTYTYKHLTDEDKAAVAETVTAPADPVVDGSLLAAWEADHYAHSLLAAEKTGDEKKAHTDAMKAIEAALANSA